MASKFTRLIIKHQVKNITRNIKPKNAPPKKVDWTTPKKIRNSFKKNWSVIRFKS